MSLGDISTVSANSYAGARDLMKQSRVKYTTSKPATLEHPPKKYKSESLLFNKLRRLQQV